MEKPVLKFIRLKAVGAKVRKERLLEVRTGTRPDEVRGIVDPFTAYPGMAEGLWRGPSKLCQGAYPP